MSSIGVYWSKHFYSLINQGNSYNPASIVVKSVYDKKEYIGVIAIVVDLNRFLSNTAIYGGNYEIRTLLYDMDNTLADMLNSQVYLNRPSMLISEDELQTYQSALEYLDKKGFYYSVSAMSYHPDWKVVAIGDVQKLESKFKPLNNSVLIVIIFGIAGLFCIYLAVLWWFTRPLIQLSKGIRQVGSGDFDYRIQMKRKDEFGNVADEFNRMSKMIKNLIRELNLANEKKRESDFKVLLSQVTPHFLYNTLNSIDMMVDVSPREDVHKAMEMLVSLLKYGLDKRDQLCLLQDEFDYIKKYIRILEFRYGSRFEYEVEGPGDLGGIKILKLILQPLVENAIFHGLHPLKDRKGSLKIHAWKENDLLVIEICDNGVGIPKDVLQGLLDEKKPRENSRSTGIGLMNVHERIQLYYGPEYGLTITSTSNAGTAVLIRIPAVFRETVTL